MLCHMKTERLELRPTVDKDLQDILALRSDPEVQKYTRQEPHTKEDVERFLSVVVPYQKKHGFGMSSVFLKDTGEFIGQAGIFHIGHYDLQPEIELGYRFHVKHWGRGYATEISKALIDWAKNNTEIEPLIAFVEPKNKASIRVLDKCNFKSLGMVDCYYGHMEKFELKLR